MAGNTAYSLMKWQRNGTKMDWRL